VHRAMCLFENESLPTNRVTLRRGGHDWASVSNSMMSYVKDVAFIWRARSPFELEHGMQLR
jgi:hypothetical protein